MIRKTTEKFKQARPSAEGGGTAAGQESATAGKVASDLRNVAESALGKVPQAQVLPTFAMYIVAALVLAIAIALIVRGESTMGGVLTAVGIIAIVLVFIFQQKVRGNEGETDEANSLFPERLKEFCDRVSATDSDLKLYSFCCPAAETLSGPNAETDEFFHAIIYHLWADPLGGSIKAICHKQAEGSPFSYHLEF